MRLSGHVNSYYAASANSAPDHPRLREAVDCDVCVVGAGLTGCSAALELAERDYDVVVLEGQRVGWGASGRSGGQLISGFGCDLSTLERSVGRADTQRLWNLSLEAVDLVRRRVIKHRLDCDLKWGYLHAAIKPRQERELQAWQQELEQNYQYPGLRLLRGADLGQIIGSRRYRAGLLDSASGHLHPLNYTLGLADVASAAGARIFEASPALAVRPGAHPEIDTQEGRVRCRYLLLCGNAYLNDLDQSLERMIMPVGTYIIASEPLDAELANRLMPADAAVADLNFVLDYFRCTRERRMLFGGRVSYSTLQPANLTKSIRARMIKVFPELRGVGIDYSWGGFVAITMSRAPHFGRLNGNVFFAQGYSGHGMALSGLAGQIMAEAIAGSAERLDLFARIRHRPFPGGRTLRTPALVLAMLYYRLRDLL
jgi:gamma-glutamylputrescine oxidase